MEIAPQPLKERELQVLWWMAQGWPQKAIALQLHLAYSTVRNYSVTAQRRLGVQGGAAAIWKARRQLEEWGARQEQMRGGEHDDGTTGNANGVHEQ